MKRSIILRFVIVSCVVAYLLVVGRAFVVQRLGRPALPTPPFVYLKPFQIWLVDGTGKIIHRNTSLGLPYDWRELAPLNQPARATLRRDDESTALVGSFALLDDTYLVLRFPYPVFGNTPRDILRNQSIVVLPLIIVCVGLCAAFIVIYGRKKSRIARRILSELKSGNLKARFPLGPLDEVGDLMRQFNEMADQIEHLVEKLRATETARTQLLRELAHDVRTPLTGLRYLIEAVLDRADDIKPESLKEKMTTAAGEVAYFGRLIEDLFLLAQVTEPHYRNGQDWVALSTIAQEEITKQRGLSAITFEAKISTAVQIPGDPFLLRRIFRNALENAAHFAKSKVTLTVDESDGRIVIVVRDDGPGFTPDALESFGRRRPTRFLDATSPSRASLGLGSVILRTIVESYAGELAARNWESGAEVRIALPRPTIRQSAA